MAGDAPKILLTVDEVVEHSVAVAAEEAAEAARERDKEEAREEAQRLARFRELLSSTLDLTPDGVDEPRLDLTYDGSHFRLYLRHWDLHVAQVCTCGENPVRYTHSVFVGSHGHLGRYLRGASSVDQLCEGCLIRSEEEKLAESEPAPTTAERLHELIREIAREAIEDPTL